MPNSVVHQPDGWKHIRSAYANITTKLNSKEPKATKENRIKAIEYCLKRLAEDLASIDAGGNALDPPADEPED